jgi:hypothetical protein
MRFFSAIVAVLSLVSIAYAGNGLGRTPAKSDDPPSSLPSTPVSNEEPKLKRRWCPFGCINRDGVFLILIF